MYGGEILRAFADVKRLFDPEGMMNPGVIVDPPPMDRQLRIGPGRERLPIKTNLSFEDQGGFAKAVELCNGSGLCRKRTGARCAPLHGDPRRTGHHEGAGQHAQVRDRRHPPAGRAHGAAHEGGHGPLRRLQGVQDGMPSRVDVASMKTEVLYQTGSIHGFSLRQKAAGNIRRQLALAALVPSLYNVVAGTRLARKAAALAGIDPRRSLPRVAKKTFSKRFPELPQGTGPAEVAIFNDTWNEYQRPEVGEGAVRLFAAAGARVRLPEVVCCGRPMLSEGLVDEARENAKRNLDLLTPLVERGVPLVGLEPSCILTLRDDYRKLLPEDERVESLAGATRLFEEAMLDLDTELPPKGRCPGPPARALPPEGASRDGPDGAAARARRRGRGRGLRLLWYGRALRL